MGFQQYVRVLFKGNYEFVTLEYALTNGYDQITNTWPWSAGMGYDVSDIEVYLGVPGGVPTYANADYAKADTSQPPPNQEEAKGPKAKHHKNGKADKVVQKREKDEEVAEQLGNPADYVEPFLTYAKKAKPTSQNEKASTRFQECPDGFRGS